MDGLCHRDCRAAAVAYGDRIRTDPAFEASRLTEALCEFGAEVKKRHPTLAVQLGIMGLSGAVEPVT